MLSLFKVITFDLIDTQKLNDQLDSFEVCF